MRRRICSTVGVMGVFLGLPTALLSQEVRVSGTVGNGGTPLSGAAVYLHPLDQEIPPVPRDAAIDQAHLRFVPSVLVVSPGSPVRFMNSDPLMHNVFGPGIREGDTFDLGTYPTGAYATWTFRREGVHVVLCHIHPEMVAYVVVTDAPFHAVTAGDGTFRIDEVPPGRYRVSVWHARRSRDTTTLEITVPEKGLDGLHITLEDRMAAAGGNS